jgi:hypothetical protein
LLIVSPLGGMVFALTGSQIKILYLGSNTSIFSDDGRRWRTVLL